MKEGWEVKTLGEVCEIFGRIGFRGYTTKDLVNSSKDGAISLSPSNIQDGEMDYSKCTYISWYKYEESPEIMISEGDILVVKTGSSYGKSALVEKLPHKATINPQSVVLKNIKVNNRFLSYQIRTKRVKDEFDKFVSGTAIPTFSQSKLSGLQIFLPPLPEQERIVSILDAEFAKIDAVKAGAEKSLQHAKDLFQAALKKELQPKEGWEIKKLQEVSEICLGLTHTPKYVDNGVPFISVKDISSGILDLSTTKQISREEFDTFPYGAKPCVGDVLFCRVGTLGKPLIVSQDQPFGIFVSVGFLRPNNKKVKAELLRYWMLSSIFDSQVKKNVVGSTLKNLNTGWLKHFSIPIPPIEIQDSVILNLTLIEERCNALQANYTKTIALCDDIKQALLRKAFSGEL